MAVKVALVVVHGVADHQPLETSRAVVDLLVSSAPHGAAYAARAAEAIRLPVDPLAPRNAPRVDHTATPLAKDRSTAKAFAQSHRSDFQREDWSAAGTGGRNDSVPGRGRSAPPGPTASGASAPPPAPVEIDRGIQISNFLLSKHLSNGAPRESYATERVRLERSTASGVTQVDVHELYWADLSRLSSAVPRIVTELFTLMFRLSKLGRETVDEARRAVLRRHRAGEVGPGTAWAWRICSTFQRILDWLFVNGVAMLMQQLGLLGFVLLALGSLQRFVPDADLPWVHRATCAVFGVVLFAVTVYRWHGSRWRSRLPLLAASALFAAMFWAEPPWIAGATVLLVFAISFAINEASLRLADERFPLVRPVGRLMWWALLLLVAASAGRQIANGASAADLEPWLRATLFGVESTLLMTKWAWIVAGLLLTLWFLSGLAAAWGQGYEARASVASGRIGLGLSIGAFLATTMAIWAMFSGALEYAVEETRFAPCLFVPQPARDPPAVPLAAAGSSSGVMCPASDPCAAVTVLPTPRAVQPAEDACLFMSPDNRSERERNTVQSLSQSAKPYLQERYRNTTAPFALLAFAVLSLLAYLVAMFIPSILAEMKLLLHEAKNAANDRAASRGTGSEAAVAAEHAERDARTRRLGRWLTAGFRHLDLATTLIVGAGVALGLLVAQSYYLSLPWLQPFEALVHGWSGSLLKNLVITAAGFLAFLVTFGRVLSRHLPSLRGPLDMALDVDNHFREFPRTGIPRARIFSRYAALLRDIRSGGYDRIVIMAHSQGSVISAEVLRYLCSDGHHEPRSGARPRLDGAALPPIRLLTLGCPLRQLYAARFPTLYRWILKRRGPISGPRAADIGVERWTNAFCSGDYVGRWLWSRHEGNDDDALGHPMVDTAEPSFGRADAYAGFDPMPPLAQPFNAATEVEVCLGLGAHTHYFETEQHTVAWLVDHLISTDTAPGAPAAIL